MILFIGQVPGEFADREAFQEVDYRQMFGPMTKWAAQIDRPERMHEYLSHAFHLATAGRPGPVVLALPEDVLAETVAVRDALPFQIVQPEASAAAMADATARLRAAQRPLLIVGGGSWTAQASEDLRAF